MANTKPPAVASHLLLIENRHFANEAVTMDGHNFRNCTFTNAQLVINGTDVFAATECKFKDFRIVYGGTAGRVIQILTQLYQTGFQPAVDGLLNDIRTNTVPIVEAGEVVKAAPSPTGRGFELNMTGTEITNSGRDNIHVRGFTGPVTINAVGGKIDGAGRDNIHVAMPPAEFLKALPAPELLELLKTFRAEAPVDAQAAEDVLKADRFSRAMATASDIGEVAKYLMSNSEWISRTIDALSALF